MPFSSKTLTLTLLFNAILSMEKTPWALENIRHIPNSLISKLKDSKNSKDLSYVCNSTYIHNRWARVDKNHFLSCNKYLSITCYAHFSKLCPLKSVILVKKQYFWNFQPSNIRNENNKTSQQNPYPILQNIPLFISK